MLTAILPPTVAGIVVLILGGLIRWALKVDKALDKHEDVLDKMVTRLDAHSALDDARFEALQALIAASNGSGYSRKRKSPDKDRD